ncbi:hypothetical protein [Lonepinella sp. BR2357]|uniref:hypothetical protein n=1 Tax=Lonepinella sp. BR2357 TaxID=3434549 RepID=UPI003F6DBCF5
MIVINSADYVVSEFKNEFGNIPPVFLPIGNKKLLTYQIENLRKNFPDDNHIVLSLPQDYQLNIDETNLIKQLSIDVILVPNNISLGMAMLYVLNSLLTTINLVKPLRVLHGDTLLTMMPTKHDCIGLAFARDEYTWEIEKNQDNAVWCGYFSFAYIYDFIKFLSATQGNFTKSVHLYADEYDVERIIVDNWYDLGHINTYFNSRTAITTQRAFNNLAINNGVVWKSGSPQIKIEAESSWFKNIPNQLKRFIPQLIQSGYDEQGRYFYETEYLSYIPLNEIFVHGKNAPVFWDNILNMISFYMRESRECINQLDDTLLEKIQQDSIHIFANKTYNRLSEYAQQTDINFEQSVIYNGVTLPCVLDIAKECVDYTLNLPIIPAVLHGDLCFSNILFDSRSNTIKVIDPRGLNYQQELTIYGNQIYDLAKLAHSFIGLYDFIIADSFIFENTKQSGIKLSFNLDERLKSIQQIFMDKEIIPNINNKIVIPPTILLFLSMIPLHFDKPDRQKAMLANALRLYYDWSR